ncbi:MAG: hypothetical protein GF390_03235 [Candidatus Pacebacteria bacterium]|nr:hypothetical protein [Candidatus Paceibacterota bacterium]
MIYHLDNNQKITFIFESKLPNFNLKSNTVNKELFNLLLQHLNFDTPPTQLALYGTAEPLPINNAKFIFADITKLPIQDQQNLYEIRKQGTENISGITSQYDTKTQTMEFWAYYDPNTLTNTTNWSVNSIFIHRIFHTLFTTSRPAGSNPEDEQYYQTLLQNFRQNLIPEETFLFQISNSKNKDFLKKIATILNFFKPRTVYADCSGKWVCELKDPTCECADGSDCAYEGQQCADFSFCSCSDNCQGDGPFQNHPCASLSSPGACYGGKSCGAGECPAVISDLCTWTSGPINTPTAGPSPTPGGPTSGPTSEPTQPPICNPAQCSTLSPASGAVVSNGTPILSAQVTSQGSGDLQYMEYSVYITDTTYAQSGQISIPPSWVTTWTVNPELNPGSYQWYAKVQNACTLSGGASPGRCYGSFTVPSPTPTPSPHIVARTRDPNGNNVRVDFCSAGCYVNPIIGGTAYTYTGVSPFSCQANSANFTFTKPSVPGSYNPGVLVNLKAYGNYQLSSVQNPQPSGSGGYVVNDSINCPDNQCYCYYWSDWNSGEHRVRLNLVTPTLTPTAGPSPTPTLTLTPEPPTPTPTAVDNPPTIDLGCTADNNGDCDPNQSKVQTEDPDIELDVSASDDNGLDRIYLQYRNTPLTGDCMGTAMTCQEIEETYAGNIEPHCNQQQGCSFSSITPYCEHKSSWPAVCSNLNQSECEANVNCDWYVNGSCSCASLCGKGCTESECEARGCSWSSTASCSNKSIDCSSLDNELGCQTYVFCQWISGECNDDPSASACSSFSSQNSCEDQHGCNWLDDTTWYNVSSYPANPAGTPQNFSDTVIFTGEANTTYQFRARSRDNAGQYTDDDWYYWLYSGEVEILDTAICGDGDTDPGEECDDGNSSNQDACLNNCTDADCGDGYIWIGQEECDDGGNDNYDGCHQDCVNEVLVEGNFYLGEGSSGIGYCAGDQSNPTSPGTGASITAQSGTIEGTINNNSYQIWLEKNHNYSLQLNIGEIESGHVYECSCPNDSGNCTEGVSTGTSDISGVHFFILDYDISRGPWWQTYGANIYSGQSSGTALSSPIPGNEGCEIGEGCIPGLILYDSKEHNESAGFAVTSGGNIVSDSESTDTNRIHYHNDHVTTDAGAHAQDSNIDTPTENYEFFSSRIDNPASYNDSSKDSTGYYLQNGNLDLDLSTAWNISGGNKVVILVNGDLNITGNTDSQLIDIEPGSLLMFVVSGNINIAADVGYSDPTTDPLTSDPNLEGIFIASGSINLESQSPASSDNKFIGAGSFVGWGGVNLNRSYDDGSTGAANHATQPTEVFLYRPDFVQTFQDPVLADIRVAQYTWQEVEPGWSE